MFDLGKTMGRAYSPLRRTLPYQLWLAAISAREGIVIIMCCVPKARRGWHWFGAP